MQRRIRIAHTGLGNTVLVLQCLRLWCVVCVVCMQWVCVCGCVCVCVCVCVQWVGGCVWVGVCVCVCSGCVCSVYV